MRTSETNNNQQHNHHLARRLSLPAMPFSSLLFPSPLFSSLLFSFLLLLRLCPIDPPIDRSINLLLPNENNQALTQGGGDGRSFSARGKETPPASARLRQQQQQQGEGGGEEKANGGQGSNGSVPSVPALALAVVAPPAGGAAAKSGRSAPSSSRRPSSRRSGNGNKKPNSAGTEDKDGPTSDDHARENSTLGSVSQRTGIDREAGKDKTQQQQQEQAGAVTDDRGVVAGSGANRLAGGGGGGGGGSGRQAAAGGTVPVPVKRRMSVQVVAAKIVDKVQALGVVCFRAGRATLGNLGISKSCMAFVWSTPKQQQTA